MEFRDFETMYLTGLQGACNLEAMQLDALAAMADAAEDRELADELQAHLAETRAQYEQIRDLLKRYRADRGELRDEAMKVMIGETERLVATVERGPLRDAALIAAAQRIEHQEIAVYGTLAAYAKMLGRHEEKRILGAILEEERAADEDLSDIATGLVNPHAVEAAA